MYNTSKLIEKNNSSDAQIEGLSSQKKQRLEPELGLTVNQDTERQVPPGITEPATRIMPVAGIGTRKSKRMMHTPSHAPASSPNLPVTSPVSEASILSDQSTNTRKTKKAKHLPSHSPASSSNLPATLPVPEVSDLFDESTRKTLKKKPLSSHSSASSPNLSETSPVPDHSTDSQVVKDKNDEDDDGWEPDDYTHLIDSECSLNMAKSILSSVRLHQTQTKDLDDGNTHSNKGVSNASGQLENASLKQSGCPKLEHLDGINPDSRIKIESVTDEGEALGINGIDRTLRPVEEETGHHTDFTGMKLDRQGLQCSQFK